MTPIAVLVVGDIVTDVLAVHSGPLAVGSDTPGRDHARRRRSAANTAAWLASLGVAGDLGRRGRRRRRGDDRLAELRGGRRGLRRGPAAGAAPTGSVIVLATRERAIVPCDRGPTCCWTLRCGRGLAGAAGAPPAPVRLHAAGPGLPARRPARAGAAAAGLTTSVDAASAAPLRRVGGRRSWTGYAGRTCCWPTSTRPHALLDDPPAGPETSRAGWPPPPRASRW